MKDNTIAEPFYKQLQKEIDRMEAKSNKYKWCYYIFRIVQIVLAGLITIFAGVAQNGENNHLILYLGAIVTAITAVETLFKFDDKRGKYKDVLFDLRELRTKTIYLLWGKERLDKGDLEILIADYTKANAKAREAKNSQKDTSDLAATDQHII